MWWAELRVDGMYECRWKPVKTAGVLCGVVFGSASSAFFHANGVSSVRACPISVATWKVGVRGVMLRGRQAPLSAFGEWPSVVGGTNV